MSSFEGIQEDLGYLQPDRAAGCLATLAKDARSWTHIEFLARLVAEQAHTARKRRLAARGRFARFRSAGRSTSSTSTSNRTVDRRLVDDIATLQFKDTGRWGPAAEAFIVAAAGVGITSLAGDLDELAGLKAARWP